MLNILIKEGSVGIGAIFFEQEKTSAVAKPMADRGRRAENKSALPALQSSRRRVKMRINADKLA